MPELAEVEYYRQVWNAGLGHRIIRVESHPEKRIFRGTPAEQLFKSLPGAVLERSEARGKQLLFSFSKKLWLGLHLGMTGKLGLSDAQFSPGKHDHLVLYQRKRALIFTDSRLFGRVRFHTGPDLPVWWSELAPDINSNDFDRSAMTRFLQRHPKLPIKAALLLQRGFPGIGNWMADEILWRAKVHPTTTAAALTPVQTGALWRNLRYVCRGALRHVGRDFSDPPKDWLFHQRWDRTGVCPKHRTLLQRRKIGGRTTAWCSQCQSRTE